MIIIDIVQKKLIWFMGKRKVICIVVDSKISFIVDSNGLSREDTLGEY